MKTRSINLFALQAVLATCLMQALPSRADTPPVATAPAAGTVVPWYVSPGVAALIAYLR